MDAEVEPVSAEVVACGEAAEVSFFFKKGDFGSVLERGVGSEEAAWAAAEDGDFFVQVRRSVVVRAWSFLRGWARVWGDSREVMGIF